MNNKRIIEDLQNLIAFFEGRSGAAPVCLLEAVKHYKALEAANADRSKIEQAIKSTAATLREVLNGAGGDYLSLQVDATSAHARVYSGFYSDDDGETDIVLDASLYDVGDEMCDADWAEMCDADNWVINWRE